MLAEPKNRTAWTLNPRGKYWSEDKNKIGQKLLESMGWKEGRGLGKHQNGIKEHIKVTTNNDNKGFGYKRTADDVWIESNNTYEKLLADLALHHNNNGSNNGLKVSNLEETSKKLRNRVHYHKLIKAKNLSHCSQNDLSAIFPKSSTHLKNKKTPHIENGLQIEKSSNTFQSNKTINEYFNEKLNELKIKNEFQNKLTNNSENKEIKVKIEETNEEINGLDVNNSSKGKKHKKSKTLKNCEENNVINVSHMETVDYIEEKHKNVKKNKRKKDKDLDEITITKHNKKKKLKKTEVEGTDSNGDKEQIQSNCEESPAKKSLSKVKHNILKRISKKVTKNIDKYKIRVPVGYDKHTLSVSESLKNYDKIYAAIARDRILNTTNLMSIHGYGYETD